MEKVGQQFTALLVPRVAGLHQLGDGDGQVSREPAKDPMICSSPGDTAAS
jgi:hypothetical protein